MNKGKKAKTLTKKQAIQVFLYLGNRRNPQRNKLIFALSLYAGLRAKEIACLQLSMIKDSEGNISSDIELTDKASKGKSGRTIPISDSLNQYLTDYLETRKSKSEFLIVSERSDSFSAQAIVNLFSYWYHDLDFNECSSHSGRRTFITMAAQKISTVGGSLRDVQDLAGHRNLQTTQNYIEINIQAKRLVTNLIG